MTTTTRERMSQGHKSYYRYPVDGRKDLDVSVNVGTVSTDATVTIIERGYATAKVDIWSVDGIALAKSVNAFEGTWGVLADWIDEYAGTDLLHVPPGFPADSPALVATALRGAA
jgi:hypothetical protein